MPAANAKRRAPSRKLAAAAPRPKRKAAAPRRAEQPVPFDGPGYHFAGFRMMCRHRHDRH